MLFSQAQLGISRKRWGMIPLGQEKRELPSTPEYAPFCLIDVRTPSLMTLLHNPD
jgi:hypothetical protein